MSNSGILRGYGGNIYGVVWSAAICMSAITAVSTLNVRIPIAFTAFSAR